MNDTERASACSLGSERLFGTLARRKATGGRR